MALQKQYGQDGGTAKAVWPETGYVLTAPVPPTTSLIFSMGCDEVRVSTLMPRIRGELHRFWKHVLGLKYLVKDFSGFAP